MNTTELVVEMRLQKNLDPYGIWIHDLCDTGAALYQLSYQANWELMIILDLNKPSKWWIMIRDDFKMWHKRCSHWCSYQIMMSSVIYYWIDPRRQNLFVLYDKKQHVVNDYVTYASALQ